jgi:DNA replication protein DnaD
MLKEALAQRDKELYNQKLEIDQQKFRIDKLEEMIQQMGRMLTPVQEQDENVYQDLNSF